MHKKTIILTVLSFLFLCLSGLSQIKPGESTMGVNSPAWKHKLKVQKIKAEKAQKKALELKKDDVIQNAAKETNQFQLLLQSLENDLKRISSIPRGPEREALKKEQILPVYTAVVDKYLEGEEVYKNPVLVQCMIWLFDAGDIDKAMTYARAAIEQKQAMPERFKRDIKTFVADSIKDWSKDQVNNGKSPEPYFSEVGEKLMAKEGNEPEWLVHEDIRIEFLKLAGRMAQDAGNLKEALALFELAEEMNPKKAKVKTVLAKLKKEITANA